MRKPVVGLLPLYIQLYDRIAPQARAARQAFVESQVRELRKQGLDVVAAPICCVRAEFNRAVKALEAARVDAIVTLHLAYSPSLESVDALAGTTLPIIILDTTPDYDFGFKSTPEMVMANHGIHGVQDLCNMLIRRGKRFMLETGHWEKSDVLARVAAGARACVAATAMRTARVGIIGKPFSGMGDFAIPFAELKRRLGMVVVPATRVSFRKFRPTAREVAIEVRRWKKTFDVGEGVSEAGLQRTAVAALTVRRWMAEEGLTAFTFCFLDINPSCGLPTAPFLEASLAMARGAGYAGEGDVLTAAFVAAISSVFPETSFGEMFCPDWKGGRLFLSHMGELNVAIMKGSPKLEEKAFPFIKSESPVLATGCMKSGQAAMVNLAPGPGGTFSMIVVRGALQAPGSVMGARITGWFKPRLPVEEVLQQYSLLGGTHHLVLVYNPDLGILARFAAVMGWDFKLI